VLLKFVCQNGPDYFFCSNCLGDRTSLSAAIAAATIFKTLLAVLGFSLAWKMLELSDKLKLL
jgi:hypothetical protein